MTSRKDNNELVKMPGFFYCPLDKSGLIELTRNERINIAAYGQGLYLLPLCDSMDIDCYLDNANIPTHRLPSKSLPGQGTVPIDLTNMSLMRTSKETYQKESGLLGHLPRIKRKVPNFCNFQYGEDQGKYVINSPMKPMYLSGESAYIFKIPTSPNFDKVVKEAENKSLYASVGDAQRHFDSLVRQLGSLSSEHSASIILKSYMDGGTRRAILTAKQANKYDTADHWQKSLVLQGILLKIMANAYKFIKKSKKSMD